METTRSGEVRDVACSWYSIDQKCETLRRIVIPCTICGCVFHYKWDIFRPHVVATPKAQPAILRLMLATIASSFHIPPLTLGCAMTFVAQLSKAGAFFAKSSRRLEGSNSCLGNRYARRRNEPVRTYGRNVSWPPLLHRLLRPQTSASVSSLEPPKKGAASASKGSSSAAAALTNSSRTASRSLSDSQR